MKNFTVTIK